jgi:hypothetical protein
MKSESRRARGPGFEQYEDDINWTAGVGRPAGIFWLDGRCVMATHGSAAEERLLDLGAVPVATLRYDPDPVERVHRSGRVERIASTSFSRERPLPGTN